MSASIADAGSVRVALQKLATLALRATGADRCAILTPDGDGQTRLLPASGASRVDGDLHKLWEKFLAMEPIDVGTASRRLAILTPPRAVTLEDAQGSPLVPRSWKSAWGSKSIAFAPLRATGATYGLLAVDYVKGRHTFTREEARLLDAIASSAGVALRNARLVDRLHHSIDEERVQAAQNAALMRLYEAVSKTSDLRSALRALNSSVCKEIGIELERVVFADPSLAALLRARRPDRNELELMARWRRELPAEPFQVGASVAVPIQVAGRVAGLLWLSFQIATKDWMTPFAASIGNALGEVALKAKLRRTAERRQRHLAVAAERERIARDLHDTVGQTFFGIGLKLQDLLTEVDDPALRDRLAELRRLASQAVADVRSAVYALSFLHVRSKGLIPSLRALADQFSRSTGIPARFKAIERLPSIPDDVESALYRVAHEALVNVERHARATGVVVSLATEDGRIGLTIRDDGVGLDQRMAADWRSAAHFGLRTMAKAVEEVRGSFKVVAAEPRGLSIVASVPLRPRRRPAIRR